GNREPEVIDAPLEIARDRAAVFDDQDPVGCRHLLLAVCDRASTRDDIRTSRSRAGSWSCHGAATRSTSQPSRPHRLSRPLAPHYFRTETLCSTRTASAASRRCMCPLVGPFSSTERAVVSDSPTSRAVRRRVIPLTHYGPHRAAENDSVVRIPRERR